MGVPENWEWGGEASRSYFFLNYFAHAQKLNDLIDTFPVQIIDRFHRFTKKHGYSRLKKNQVIFIRMRAL